MALRLFRGFPRPPSTLLTSPGLGPRASVVSMDCLSRVLARFDGCWPRLHVSSLPECQPSLVALATLGRLCSPLTGLGGLGGRCARRGRNW